MVPLTSDMNDCFANARNDSEVRESSYVTCQVSLLRLYSRIRSVSGGIDYALARN